MSIVRKGSQRNSDFETQTRPTVVIIMAILRTNVWAMFYLYMFGMQNVRRTKLCGQSGLIFALSGLARDMNYFSTGMVPN